MKPRPNDVQCLISLDSHTGVEGGEWFSTVVEGPTPHIKDGARWRLCSRHCWDAWTFSLTTVYVFCQSSRQRHFPQYFVQQEKHNEIEDVARPGVVESLKIGRKVANIQCCHNWLHENREIVNSHGNRMHQMN